MASSSSSVVDNIVPAVDVLWRRGDETAEVTVVVVTDVVVAIVVAVVVGRSKMIFHGVHLIW